MGQILEMDRTHVSGDDEEACVRFYVDNIQVCGFWGFILFKANITVMLTGVF